MMKLKITNFFFLLNLSFVVAGIADLQAYHGQEIVNKGLAKGNELLEFVKSSKKAQIGLGVAAAGILVLTVVALKRKSPQLEQSAAAEKSQKGNEQEPETDDIDDEAMADFYQANKRK